MTSVPTVAATGLTKVEVRERHARGQVNAVEAESSRSVEDILRANVLTRFNAILGSLLVVILIVGPLQDAVFGLILLINALVGIVQELRAKRTLDRLAVVTAPKVHVVRDGSTVQIRSEAVVVDDVLVARSGDQVVVDGEVIEAVGLEVDESLVTGEADAVPKHPGDRVLSGSFVAAGSATFRATTVGEATYAAGLAKEARQLGAVRSQLQTDIDRMLRVITWFMIPTALVLVVSQLVRNTGIADAVRGSVAGIVTMVPEGLVLLTSIAFAVGALRLGRRRVLVQEMPAIELLARVDTVCIDKTGTLTSGLLTCNEVESLDGRDVQQPLAALIAATGDTNSSATAIAEAVGAPPPDWSARTVLPFSSARKWSAADFDGRGTWVLGAPEVVLAEADDEAPGLAHARRDIGEAVATGERIVLLARAEAPLDNDRLPYGLAPVAIVHLADEIRPDAHETLRYLAHEGVRVVVLSGDHPRTVGAVSARLGIAGAESPVDARRLDDGPALAEALVEHSVFGRVTPVQKRDMVQALQAQGHVVAMTGDGVNDVLALKEADLGIAMGSGTDATRAVARLVLLDSQFSALPAVVAEGRKVIANVERVANLFLTKTVYATMLAIMVGVALLPFPFLPRHLTLVSTLTIGIPAFFLALAPNERRYQSGFLLRVLRFAVPAGLVTGAATFVAYALARDEPGTSLTAARTTATLVLFAVALWILSLLARPATLWRQWLIVAMAVLFVFAFVIPAARDFFALEAPSAIVWLAAVGVAALCGAAIELGWRAAGWVRDNVAYTGGRSAVSGQDR